MELEKNKEWMVLVTMVETFLGALSFSLLTGTTEQSRIHWMKVEKEMELMELWIEEVWWFDEMTALNKDLLSLQKRVAIEGLLTLVDVQVKADSVAADSSS